MVFLINFIIINQINKSTKKTFRVPRNFLVFRALEHLWKKNLQISMLVKDDGDVSGTLVTYPINVRALIERVGAKP